jgi:hypothetical protein
VEDDKIKFFEEEFPDIFSGTNALIEDKLKKREVDTDALIEAKLKKRDFDKALNDAYPNWKQIWHTPKFQAFLSEEADITGVERYAFINDAFQRLDSEVAIRFLRIFFEEKTKRKDLTQSPGRAMTVEQARKALKDLAGEKSRGLWKGREKAYQEKSDSLYKIIIGSQSK